MEKKELSCGAKVALVLTSLFICFLITFTFFLSPYPYIITCPIIVLTCLLIIVVLSNSFDNLSVGKILSLQKSANENKKRVEVLEKERSEFFLKLSNISLQSQKVDITLTNQGPNFAFMDRKDREIHNDVRNQPYENCQNDSQCSSVNMTENSVEKSNIHRAQPFSIAGRKKHPIINREIVEKYILEKYFGIEKKDSIVQYVKLVDSVQDIDSISRKPVYYDAYLKDSTQEFFIEIINILQPTIDLHNRLYVQLNKVLAYKKAKNSNVHFVLILAIEKGFGPNQIESAINRITDSFQPAINHDLLKIAKCEYDTEKIEREQEADQDRSA